MTFAEKLAALPEMPLSPSESIHSHVWNEYYQERSFALRARISLLLETVGAYTEASDFLNSRVESDERAGAYHENRAEIEALNMAYADLRTLQARLEGERI